ncbi:pentatricopeptide repeat-containing protein At3g24000, mitochondrial-like isoform X1 [Phoenix dactylifera]|uniref:Pentatricopeptide repeat-containing protein At3g24000, mitochondrial-like isoform X1 n=1 Tax=Phoenix dactylifera TaxID=42345 RepID=A0A8B7MWH3_PHODC|nr:pentatricopeptide repeat-containing protein At3g24000, mitochondrial-like isoform X1 [Phoenix dactylifera]
MALVPSPISCSNARLPSPTPRRSPRTQPTTLVRNPPTTSVSQDDPNSPHQTFDKMPDQQHSCASFSSTSLILAHTKRGDFSRAFELFTKMSRSGWTPDEFALGSLLKASYGLSDVSLGEQLHAKSIRAGLASEPGVRTSLITMYSSTDLLEEARQVFDEVPPVHEADVPTWNSILSAYVFHGWYMECFLLFAAMLELAQLNPTDATYAIMIHACTSSKEVGIGKALHAMIVKDQILDKIKMHNSLITMYAKSGLLEDAKKVFKAMDRTNVVSWNAMISGLEQNGECESAIELFRRLAGFEGQVLVRPNRITFLSMLNAISTALAFNLGREVHAKMIRSGLEFETSIGNSLITMYGKFGQVVKGRLVFERLSSRDVVTWNSMLAGYAQNDQFKSCCVLFREMQSQACSGLASIELGKQLHAFTIKHRLHHCNSQTFLLSINNALISMYSKCGSISDAEKVFKRIARKDVFSWTSMITGYAHHGMASESLQLFRRMTRDGVRPNSVTFLGLFSACAHAGLVKEGMHCFALMRKESDTKPSIEHYACMVDLFGRAGRFETAQAIIWDGISCLRLQRNSSLCLWKVLLGTCHAHKQLDLGIHVATKILELDPDDETTYVLLSNLYASFGLWEDAIGVRSMMRERGLKKEAGCSSVEVENKRHVFVAGGGCHPNRKEIYKELEELDEKCRYIGYVPMTECVLHDVDEAQKELILSCHSEKLAVSFALLQTRARKGVIRVIKNLRVCGDCHNWMKFASEVAGREIILRDSRRFHTFKDGKCSCGDYW